MNKDVLLGLNDQQVEESKSKNGTNELSKKEPKSVLSMFVDALKDICIIVLLASLGVKVLFTILGMVVPSLHTGNDALEIVSIIMAIALATGFSTLSEYRNTTRSEALQEEYNKSFAKVIRNGKLISILTSEIVKGDVILLQAGDKVPVDGLVIDGKLKVSQAALNGESRDENKEATADMEDAESTDYSSLHKVFMGSVVTSGEAYMVATVVGDASELGKINQSLNEDDENERKDATTLKLEVLVGQIGKLGLICAVAAGVLDVVIPLLHATEPITFVSVILLIASAIMLGASILIMAVPEGLALIVSLVQSMNTESMYKKNILVSHKAAFSDSAFLNILFSDKTGTITQGKLSLVEFILGDSEIVSNLENKEFIDAITINNLAKVSENKAIGSNNMDRALLTYAIDHGYTGATHEEDKVKELSGFDSEKKCATAEMIDGTIFWKGATENIIDKVTHYIDKNGSEKEFTSDDRDKVESKMYAQSMRAMKLLSVAKMVDEKVILLAILCLRDDVRPDAIKTVKELRSAGIQVVMVTGDMKETAVAIAREAGIVKDTMNEVILTHDELEQLSDEELKEKLPNLRVVSRAKPLDKKRLVNVAQQLDYVVGMTGDGVNDAPALKQADVGFAMGDGTAVAQEAGDVVILNNSLTSIKDCILNSRTMSKSVSKFLIFQLTVNVSTLLMNLVAPILGWTEPFSIVQILWINLIMDTLAALAYGGEPILERYMEEKPAKRTAKILTPYIKSAIGLGSVFITLGAVVILENMFGILDFVRPENVTDITTFDKTFMFAFFIYSIIFNSLNTRSEQFNLFEHIGENKRFIYVMGSIFILQTLLLEFGGKVFGTVPLTLKAYVVSILLALLIIPFDLIRKTIFRTKSKKKNNE